MKQLNKDGENLLQLSIVFLLYQACVLPAYAAAGYQINGISPSLQGNALAGAAAAAGHDVSSIFINPATLSTINTWQAYIGGSELMPTTELSQASAIHTFNIPGTPASDIIGIVQGTTTQNNM